MQIKVSDVQSSIPVLSGQDKHLTMLKRHPQYVVAEADWLCAKEKGVFF